jgi:hypothetical protein
MIRRNVKHGSSNYLSFFLEGVSVHLYNRLGRGSFGKIIKTERLVFRRRNVIKIIEHSTRGVDGRRRESRDIVRGLIVNDRNTFLFEK